MNELVGAWEADAPPEARALTNAATPLPEGAVFWPTLGAAAEGEGAYRIRALLATAGLVVVYFVVMSRWIGDLAGGTFEGDAAESFLTLHLMMTFPGLWIVYPSWRTARSARLQPRGRRRGLFLLPEHVVAFNGERYAVLRRAPGRFVVKPRWRPIRRTWDLQVTPGFTEPFTLEVDARAVDPAVAATVVAGLGAG